MLRISFRDHGPHGGWSLWVLGNFPTRLRQSLQTWKFLLLTGIFQQILYQKVWYSQDIVQWPLSTPGFKPVNFDKFFRPGCAKISGPGNFYFGRRYLEKYCMKRPHIYSMCFNSIKLHRGERRRIEVWPVCAEASGTWKFELLTRISPVIMMSESWYSQELARYHKATQGVSQVS